MKNEENLAYFLNEAKTIKPRELGRKLRVAFLASSTINGFEETMRVKCYQKGIDCVTYVADYNQYNQELLNENSGLYQFKPDITFLILDTRHILGDYFFSWYSVPYDDRSKIISKKISEIEIVCNTFAKNSDSKLIVTSLQIPNYSPYGIDDGHVTTSLRQIISQINTELFQWNLQYKLLTYDFDQFVRKYGE